MSTIQVLMAAESAANHRAVRRTAYRHRYIAPRPLVVTAFNLSGEAAAPIGFLYGTDPKKPKVVIAAEPRNRVSRFGAIHTFAAELVKFLEPCLELEVVGQRQNKAGESYDHGVAVDTPQIVVPNRATLSYLGTRLGRSLRYLGLKEENAELVPKETWLAGAHLSWLAEHALLPGQSIFLAATEVLGRHFVTGQSDLENENLASLMAWIENPQGTGLENILAAENAAYGPVPDPAWEVKLEPKVKEWTDFSRSGDKKGVKRIEKEVHEMVREALLPAYEHTHRALDLLRAIPAARSVQSRWSTDHILWSGYARRVAIGRPRFTVRNDALRAAQLLERWSSAQDKLEYDEAIDDSLVLAELDAAGRCLTGKVVKVDAGNKEVKPGKKNRSSVPLVKLELTATTRLLKGEHVIWVEEPTVQFEIRSIDECHAELAAMSGAKSGEILPRRGSTAVLAALSIFGGLAPKVPDEIPWTHKGKDTKAPKDDGSPDMSADDLAGLPLVGQVSLDAVPGVVQ